MKSLTYAAVGLAALWGAGSCGGPKANAALQMPANLSTAPRIVSLDFCADQYALELLPREQILALSPDARAAFSYHKTRAQNIPTVRPRAEDILALQPDLILRAYGGGPQAARLFEAAGIPVINIGWAHKLGGEDAGSVSAVMRQTARDLGQALKGEALIANYQSRLAQLETQTPSAQTALYMTPYGVTTGPGSLVDQLMTLAGFENFQSKPGWNPLPLERLTRKQPDYIITSFFDSHDNITANWSAMRHPIASKALSAHPELKLKGAWTSCGAWFLMDAAEALSRGRDKAASSDSGDGDGS